MGDRLGTAGVVGFFFLVSFTQLMLSLHIQVNSTSFPFQFLYAFIVLLYFIDTYKLEFSFVSVTIATITVFLRTLLPQL